MLKTDQTINEIKLQRFARRIIEGRIYSRRQAAFDRRVVQCVHSHIHASAGELQERLNEIFRDRDSSISPTEDEIQAEIDKLRA